MRFLPGNVMGTDETQNRQNGSMMDFFQSNRQAQNQKGQGVVLGENAPASMEVCIDVVWCSAMYFIQSNRQPHSKKDDVAIQKKWSCTSPDAMSMIAMLLYININPLSRSERRFQLTQAVVAVSFSSKPLRGIFARSLIDPGSYYCMVHVDSLSTLYVHNHACTRVCMWRVRCVCTLLWIYPFRWPEQKLCKRHRPAYQAFLATVGSPCLSFNLALHSNVAGLEMLALGYLHWKRTNSQQWCPRETWSDLSVLSFLFTYLTCGKSVNILCTAQETRCPIAGLQLLMNLHGNSCRMGADQEAMMIRILWTRSMRRGTEKGTRKDLLKTRMVMFLTRFGMSMNKGWRLILLLLGPERRSMLAGIRCLYAVSDSLYPISAMRMQSLCDSKDLRMRCSVCVQSRVACISAIRRCQCCLSVCEQILEKLNQLKYPHLGADTEYQSEVSEWSHLDTFWQSAGQKCFTGYMPSCTVFNKICPRIALKHCLTEGVHEKDFVLLHRLGLNVE